jgi:hypothetical protein
MANEIFPWVYRSLRTPNPDDLGDTQITIVGCGGTGARVIGPLLKVIPDNWVVTLVDHDIVETRNLLRQNFIAEDVGRYKAVVLAERYSEPSRQIRYAVGKFTEELFFNRIYPATTRNIVIGCTDSNEFRADMAKCVDKVITANRVNSTPLLWIDAGNERTTGQVVMEGIWWGYVRNTLGETKVEVNNPIDHNTCLDLFATNLSQYVNNYKLGIFPQSRQALPDGGYTPRFCRIPLRFTGVTSNFPELLLPDTSDQPACGMRLDLQTVAVNQLAASWIVCMVSNLQAAKESSIVGVQFSTTGTCKPILMQTPKIYHDNSAPRITI